MLDNIPPELSSRNQWVCAGSNKNPITPSGNAASVTDPSTWSSFLEARSAGHPFIGFVLTKDDPYAIIDLDDPYKRKDGTIVYPGDEEWDNCTHISKRHQRIFNAFQSYAEVSQSGRGVHIVVRGSLPSGVRRDKVEIYSSERYMIFTGSTLNNLPIADYQELLMTMHGEMASTIAIDLEEIDAVFTDEQIIDMASCAVNGEKFNRLCSGDFASYNSQSEADFALLTILCFYSKSDSQVRRIFRYTGLGRREKAMRNDDYLDRALSKIRGKQAQLATPLVDISGLINGHTTKEADNSETVGKLVIPVPPPIPTNPLTTGFRGGSGVIFPPGLVGDVASYIFTSAIRPVREVALAAAISLVSGCAGRHYNVSSTGLNQYIILLAKTGTGKEGAASGIDMLLASIRAECPGVDNFLGPGTFASGQALVRVLDKTPSFVSVIGEVGLLLQQICDKNANANQLQLRRVLLDIYAKSGWNKFLRPSVYSDTEKNTQLVRAPNVTILGESTPENFYGALESAHVSEGLIPRFLVLEYEGGRPPMNPTAFHKPEESLRQRLLALCQTVLTMSSNETHCAVQMDRWAYPIFTVFNEHADEVINGSGEDEVLKQLWNRAHLKAMKLAALVAVGVNPQVPTITKDIAMWAIELVQHDIENMIKKFSSGYAGDMGDHTQDADLRCAIDRYLEMTAEQRKQYRIPVYFLTRGNLIPYGFLKRYLAMRASFKNDKRGATIALKVALEDSLRTGMLKQIPVMQARTECQTDMPVYFRGESW